jgi:hypothetical protein
MLNQAVTIAALLLAFIGISGCGKGPSKAEATRFNDALVDANGRIGKAGAIFAEAAGAAIGGGIIEVGKAKREFENLSEAVDRAKADTRSLKIPDTPAAKAFFDASQKLLKKEEAMVKEDCRLIVAALEDSLLTPQQRLAKIRPIVGYLGSLDNAEVAAVKAAQVAFAKEQNFELRSTK